MTSAGKLTTKAIAVIIIVAMLDAVGVPPIIMVLFTGMCFVVWLFTRRAQAREVERIFDFYIAADAVLREEERRWYGFEIAEVIEHGESLLDIMPDPPPLNYYVLGALYQRLGNHTAAVEYLSRVTEDERCYEAHRTEPSPQLRRYVSMLRRIEYQPSLAPQTLAAIRSLERARQRNASQLLGDSREQMGAEQHAVKEEKPQAPEATETHYEPMFAPSLPLSAISAPPPIAKVLHDVYDVCDVYRDETGPNN
jgi:tetratricopeptide (TPR) repeat protein